MVEPMGLEPTTFSLQGNCAPNCATAPYCAFALYDKIGSELRIYSQIATA